MKDKDKTQEQLIKELAELRQRIAELEAAEIKRKGAEEALRESEEMFRTLSKVAPVGIFRNDSKGNCTYINEWCCEIIGLSLEQSLRNGWTNVLHPEDRKRIVEAWKNTTRKLTPFKEEYRFLRPDGSIRWVIGETLPIKSEHGKIQSYIGAIIDITERKKTEEVLREERDKAEQYLDIAEVILVALNKKGEITLINKKGNQILGYKEEGELLGKNWFTTCVPSHLRKKIKNGFLKLMAGERELTEFYENPVLTKSGIEKMIAWHNTVLKDAAGNIVGTLSSGEDITERKQAEKARQESEERFRLAFENANTGVCLVDLEGNLTRVNSKMCEIFGYTKEEFESMTVNDIAHPEDIDKSPAFIKDTLQGKIDRGAFEKRYIHKQGHVVMCQVSSSLVRNAEGTPLYFISHVHDITERKRAEEELRESQERFKIAAQSASDLIWEWDIPTGRLHWFGAIDELLGYAPGKFPRTIEAWEKHIHPDDHDRVMAALDQHLNDQTPYDEEYRVRRKDGTYRYWIDRGTAQLDMEGNPLKMVGACTDITERKQAEEKLRESETRFRTLFEAIPDTVLVHNDKGTILHINEIGAQKLEWSAKDLVGRNLREIVTPENAASIADHVRETHKVGWSMFETTYVARSGWKTMAEVNEHPIKFGKEKAILSVARDITERKRFEKMLEQERQDLKLIIDSSPIIVFYKDKEGRFIRVNKTFAEAMKMPEGDLVGKTVLDLYSPQIAQGMTDDDQKIFQSRRPKLNIIEQYESASGIRWVQTDKIPICDKHGLPIGLIGFAQDITERKQAEEALQESVEKYRDLVENINDILYTTDKSGIITYISPTIESISGYTPPEIIGRLFSEFVYQEDVPQVLEKFQELVSGHVEPHEYRMVTKSGDVRWVRTSSQPFLQETRVMGVRGVLADITERKEAEEALKKGQVLLEESQRLAHIGSWDMDVKTHEVIWSDEAFRIFGLRPQEFQPTFEEFINRLHPDDQDIIPRHYRETLETKKFRAFNYRITRPNGTVRWIHSTGVVHSDDAGTPVRIVGTLQDITDRKQAEEALQLSYGQLRDALISTVDALASTVEMKDQYIAGHQPRVTHLACAIAEEMGLPEEQIEGIHMAGSIHDIGKIMVPAEILNKPGPLAEIQYEMVKMHPRAGYDILKGIEFPWPVAQIVLQHHERMDGSGYPQGLSGEEIMLEARILAVANVIESMTSHRPYRPAFGLQEALEKISKNRGILYDPSVTDACLKLFTEKGFTLDSAQY